MIIKEKQLEMVTRRTTKNFGYKKTVSKDGSFTCHIQPRQNDIISAYCLITGDNNTKYINRKMMDAVKADFKQNIHKLINTEHRDALATLIQFCMGDQNDNK